MLTEERADAEGVVKTWGMPREEEEEGVRKRTVCPRKGEMNE